MTPIQTDTPVEGPRAWAKRDDTQEAADELLNRIGFAPPTQIGWASGGERRLLVSADATGSTSPDVSANLDDALPGLGQMNIQLVLAAMSTPTSGSHPGQEFIVEGDAYRLGEPSEWLFLWPEVTA